MLLYTFSLLTHICDDLEHILQDLADEGVRVSGHIQPFRDNTSVPASMGFQPNKLGLSENPAVLLGGSVNRDLPKRCAELLRVIWSGSRLSLRSPSAFAGNAAALRPPCSHRLLAPRTVP